MIQLDKGRGNACARDNQYVAVSRIFLQCMGGMVCILFAIQGVLIMLEQTPASFFQACHWLAEGILCIGVGLLGLIYEVRVFFPKITRNFARFAAIRFGQAVGYWWAGCWIMDGRTAVGDGWIFLARFTGVLAWIVALGDILTSCLSDPRRDGVCDPNGNALMESAGGRASAVPEPEVAQEAPSGGWATFASIPAANVIGTGGVPEPIPAPQGAPDLSTFEAPAETNPLEDSVKTPSGVDAPPAGWNTVGEKPFGCQ